MTNPRSSLDPFWLLACVCLFLWVGKEQDLLPFIYGPAPCKAEVPHD